MKQITRFLIFSALVFCLQLSFPLAQGCKDQDSDGYYNKEGCGTPVDCDDKEPNAYPGAPEICNNGKDNDCDGTVDNKDSDNDGYIDELCTGGDDCDDNDPSTYPGAPELCNDKDNDCDGTIEEDIDNDSDGYFGCEGPDCNDFDPDINPGAYEICNGYDDDCNGSLDEGCKIVCDDFGKWRLDVRVTYAGSNYPSLVWTGDEYGISWSDARDGELAEVYFARLDPSGNKIGSDVRVTYDSSSSYDPSIAWTGSEYGVSWEDFRDGNGEIYFARLDPSGNKIGSDVRVTYDSSQSNHASLVWTGDEFGVSWFDHGVGNWEIYFARLEPSGNKIGSDVRVTYDSAESLHPSLVWSGSEYGISWHDDKYIQDEIYFVRLDASGNKIGSDIRITDDDNEMSYYPSLVWASGEYGISWHDGRSIGWGDEIYFARLDASGNKISSDIRITDDDDHHSQYPCLAWNGSEYGLAWTDRKYNSPYYQTSFVRLDHSGNRIGSEVRVTFNDGNSSVSYDRLLVWTGTEYAVTWNDDRTGINEIYFARLACCDDDNDSDNYNVCQDCNENDPTINPGTYEICDSVDNDCDGTVDDDCCYPDVDNDSDSYNECEDCDENDADIYPGAPQICDDGKNNDCDHPNWPDLTGTNEVDDDADSYTECGGDCDDADADTYPGASQICDGVNNDCNDPDWPTVSGDEIDDDADSFAECAGDCNDADADIYPGASEICNGYDDDCDSSIDEGCDTSCDNPEEYGDEMRISDCPIEFMEENNSSLVWTGNEYAVSWWDNGCAGYFAIYFARLDYTGNRIGPDVRISEDGSDSYSPSLAWTGSEYGISWHDNRDGNSEIYFVRLDSSGNKIGSNVRITEDSGGSSKPSLVWAGSEYGVGWYDDRDGNSEIYFARIDSSGNKIGSDIRVTNDSSYSGPPSLTWSGSEYGVSWRDSRDGNAEIYFVRLDSTGNKIGSDLRITEDPSSSQTPSLVWTSDGYAVSWKDWRDTNTEIYFAKLDATGNKIGSDVRITYDPGSSGSPCLVWTGSEHGISWSDARNGELAEVYFARLDFSGNNIGADFEIGIDDSYISTDPSLVWAENGYGISWTDEREGFLNDKIYFTRIGCCGNDIGAIITGLGFHNDKETMQWDSHPNAERYDVMRGDLRSLRSSGGDFTSSLTECSDDDGLDTRSSDTDEPLPGEGFYYLVRGQADCRNGTCDCGQPSQVGERDSEINESPNKCP